LEELYDRDEHGCLHVYATYPAKLNIAPGPLVGEDRMVTRSGVRNKDYRWVINEDNIGEFLPQSLIDYIRFLKEKENMRN